MSIIIEDWYSILCTIFENVKTKINAGCPKENLIFEIHQIFFYYVLSDFNEIYYVLSYTNQKWVSYNLIELNGYHR